jgi:4-amino-4-deoxychorismate lyase
LSRFLETIRIENGKPMHLEWHQRRVEQTLLHFFPGIPLNDLTLNLSEMLSACDIPSTGHIRCRVIYDINTLSVEFIPYSQRQVRSLRVIEVPDTFDYRFKYADRREIEIMFAGRGDADDILMARQGWIMDTSIANIAFRKDTRWYTPAHPLLAGTTWKRLMTEKKIIPRPIHQSSLHQYDSFRIFNAMIDWGGEEMSVDAIRSD